MNPTKEQCVKLLMKQADDVVRDVPNKKGGSKRRNVTCCVYICPLKDNCKKTGKVVFEKGSGWTNPFRHLLSCVSDNNVDDLHQLYKTTKKDKLRDGDLRNSDNISIEITATEREKAMHAYMRFITFMSLPISYVQTPEIRRFCKYDTGFSFVYFKEVMFKLTELVEKRIGQLMRGTKGAILHDGWTHNSLTPNTYKTP